MGKLVEVGGSWGADFWRPNLSSEISLFASSTWGPSQFFVRGTAIGGLGSWCL